MITQDLGIATAYGYAKSKGYTGTEEEYAELMASYATVGQTAVTAAQTATTKASEAATSATTATNKATEATTAATTATTKAGEASTSASTATSAKDTAVSASQTATTKATEATTAAATATSAKTDAVAANTAAQSAKTAAQTAQTGAETAAASVSASAEQIATNADDIEQLMSNFVDMKSDGVVPSAEQILTDKGITDSVPYHYRKTGGDRADRLYDQIVGGTVCFNQLAKEANKSGSITFDADTTAYHNKIGPDANINIVSGHKYYISANISRTISGNNQVSITLTGGIAVELENGDPDGVVQTIRSANTNIPSGIVAANNYAGKSGFSAGDTVSYDDYKLLDLTQMFGSTIADYIYQLEQTTAGAGVAFFKALFPNDYYEYNAGELVSVSGLSEHKTVGFNQWDEEVQTGRWSNTVGSACTFVTDSTRYCNKTPIRVLPNSTYYVKTPNVLIIMLCDADMNVLSVVNTAQGNSFTTQSNCAYICFYPYSTGMTYNHDICINFSDPAHNGTYEPYKAHSYPLDSTLTLRGLFKLDANNKLYADGDTYEYTGKVTRNTILRAYQSGDESLANAITDGTNTVVYSANASTEQAEPYQHLQQCDPNGTEEYVSTGIVPVGHKSFYLENLRAKVEQLPWNFANLIAPTESAFVATRNYTTGALLIVNNVLYKATANIANGGTITPNTNCTATTLAEIISALA